MYDCECIKVIPICMVEDGVCVRKNFRIAFYTEAIQTVNFVLITQSMRMWHELPIVMKTRILLHYRCKRSSHWPNMPWSRFVKLRHCPLACHTDLQWVCGSKSSCHNTNMMRLSWNSRYKKYCVVSENDHRHLVSKRNTNPGLGEGLVCHPLLDPTLYT